MKKLYILLIAIFTINIANAQWQQTSLDSTFIRALIVNGNNIFAGSNHGVYLSTDNGNNWSALNSSLPSDIVVASFAINGSNIFLGSSGYGVYLSTNNGSNWALKNNGLTTNDVESIITNGNNIYAGTWGGGIYLSTNNGNNWYAVNSVVLTSAYISSLAINGNNIFAGNASNGDIYLSSNNGGNWTTLNNGLSGSGIKALTIKDSNIFAATVGGMFLSTNNGTNWVEKDSGITNLNIYALANSGNNIFAGTRGGVFLSTNNGNYWTTLKTGLIDTNVWSLAINGGYIFAGTHNSGVWKLQFLDTVTTSSYPANGGNTIGSGVNIIKKVDTVKAIPNVGYTFVNWTENGNIVSSDSVYTFIDSTNRNLVAHFNLNQYTITTTTNPTNGGTTNGSGTFNYNQSCTVKAIPNTGYTFINWTENSNIVSTDTNYTFTLTTNRNLVANFTLNIMQYTITTSSNPIIGGTTNGGGTFNNNQSCTVKAIPNTGYSFANWKENGNIVSTDTNYSFTVTANRNLVANFTQNTTQYTITTSSSPIIGGTTNGGGTFNSNQSCTVKANASNGYTFVNWTENGSTVSTDTNYTFTVTANRNLVANFLLITLQYTITTSTVPSNGGIAFGGGTFTYNQTCNLKAQPANNFVFISWSENGVPVSIDTNYSFTVTANRNLVANFFSTLGIEVNSLQNTLKLYPNPATNQVTINLFQLNSLGKLEVYNMLGQLIYEENLIKGSSQLILNTQNYKTGLYKVILKENGIVKGLVNLVKE